MMISKSTRSAVTDRLLDDRLYDARAQAVEPILSRDTSTDAYSRRVVPFGG